MKINTIINIFILALAMANAFWDEPTPMDVDYEGLLAQPDRYATTSLWLDNDSPIEKTLIPKRLYRKCTIPKTLKINVWNLYIGKEIGSAKCMCCRESEIIQGHFEAGHVISERDGGATNIENLRPICSLCNKSMGAKNMLEFMKEYGYRKPRNWNGKSDSSKKKDVIIIE